jgi:hypothetical protein
MLALLRQGGVVDHRHRARPADEPVGGLRQLVLQGGRGPGRAPDEVMQLLDVIRRHAPGHRLDALALAGQEQALQVDRRPAPLRLAREPLQERLQPPLERLLPCLRR